MLGAFVLIMRGESSQHILTCADEFLVGLYHGEIYFSAVELKLGARSLVVGNSFHQLGSQLVSAKTIDVGLKIFTLFVHVSLLNSRSIIFMFDINLAVGICLLRRWGHFHVYHKLLLRLALA